MVRLTKIFSQLMLLLAFYLIASRIDAKPHYSLPYDNIPISARTWEEIDITWPNVFNLAIPNRASLLRPISYAKSRGLVLGGHVHMKLGEFGVPNANITVTNINPLSQQTVIRIEHLPKKEKPIIGVYIHQTNDVRTYHFKNSRGHISIIHATPVHPFYIKNLHTYVPISQVTDSMRFAGKNNESIHLVCPQGKRRHCGTSYHQGKITTVYNVEVYQKHFYRVGNNAIKVHNPKGVACGLDMDSSLRQYPANRDILNQGFQADLAKNPLPARFGRIEANQEDVIGWRVTGESLQDAFTDGILPSNYREGIRNSFAEHRYSTENGTRFVSVTKNESGLNWVKTTNLGGSRKAIVLVKVRAGYGYELYDGHPVWSVTIKQNNEQEISHIGRIPAEDIIGGYSIEYDEAKGVQSIGQFEYNADYTE